MDSEQVMDPQVLSCLSVPASKPLSYNRLICNETLRSVIVADICHLEHRLDVYSQEESCGIEHDADLSAWKEALSLPLAPERYIAI